MSARAYRLPDAAGVTGFVWVHGGGWIGGDLDMAEAEWVSMALAARGFAVLSVEYRKALNDVCCPVPSGTDVGAIGGDVMRELCLQYAGSEDVLDDVYALPANGDLRGQPAWLAAHGGTS